MNLPASGARMLSVGAAFDTIHAQLCGICHRSRVTSSAPPKLGGDVILNGLLVRVGADLSSGGGSWNGPVNSLSREFVYVAIPETLAVHRGMERPFSALAPVLLKLGVDLPDRLSQRHMHLDPDFDYLTYGDQGERAKQLRAGLRPSDFIVFYAALADVRTKRQLVYAIIGLFVIKDFRLATKVKPENRDINAHSRRRLKPDAEDLIVCARPSVSGRLTRCIPMGEYRNRAYRVRPDLLAAWGGLSVKDGYLQRSARLPRFLDPIKFFQWFQMQNPVLVQSNNDTVTA